ncbi:MAG: hypothetical protein ACREKH_01850 [Candidatus Rokuibacteriota bacterium]
MTERLVDRRTALQAIGLAGAAGVVAGTAILAGAGGAQAQTASTPKNEPAAVPPSEDEKKEPSAEAKRLGEIAKVRFGQHLNEEQLKSLVEALDGGLQSGQRLRKLGLQNADEPDFLFRADF